MSNIFSIVAKSIPLKKFAFYKHMIVDFMDYILQVWIYLYDGKMKEETKNIHVSSLLWNEYSTILILIFIWLIKSKGTECISHTYPKILRLLAS